MCDHGTTVTLLVPVDGRDAYEGETTWKLKPVDACISDVVQALNDGGLLTRSCCCGHGKFQPEIRLQDGRHLKVLGEKS